MEDVSRKKIIETAKQYLGFPSSNYNKDVENNGADERGFTCSGFVRFILEKSGVRIPKNIRHAREFFDYFGVLVHEDKKKPGDLVFFSRYGTYPNHVGIVISDDEYIFSSGMRKGSVVIKKIKGTYRTKKNASAHETIYTKNPIGFKRIAYPKGNYQYVLK